MFHKSDISIFHFSLIIISMDISSSSTSKTIKLYNSKLSQTVLNRFNDEELKWDDGILNLSSK